LSDAKQAERGDALYSSHNRCLYVSNVAEMIPTLNLWENLTFGTQNPSPDRIRKIFHRLKLDACEKLSAQLEADIQNFESPRKAFASAPESSSLSARSGGSYMPLLNGSENSRSDSPGPPPCEAVEEDHKWYTRLSFSEKKRIHLARALIFNPEYLVLNKPTEALDPDNAELILAMLREYVDGRGVELDRSRMSLRRPRSLIFSGGTSEDSHRNIEIADVVWSLSGSKFEELHPYKYARHVGSDFGTHGEELGFVGGTPPSLDRAPGVDAQGVDAQGLDRMKDARQASTLKVLPERPEVTPNPPSGPPSVRDNDPKPKENQISPANVRIDTLWAEMQDLKRATKAAEAEASELQRKSMEEIAAVKEMVPVMAQPAEDVATLLKRVQTLEATLSERSWHQESALTSRSMSPPPRHMNPSTSRPTRIARPQAAVSSPRPPEDGVCVGFRKAILPGLGP